MEAEAHKPYSSFAELRSAHGRLSGLRQHGEPEAAVLGAAAEFVARGCRSGIILDGERERWVVQSYLDYWSAELERAGLAVADSSLADFDLAQAPELADELCPYCGLDPFEEQDVGRFFGRKTLVAHIEKALHQQRLIAVVGPSGSGKSSVVRAGLLPQLRRRTDPALPQWTVLPSIVPTADPAAAMRSWLLAPLPGPLSAVAVAQALLAEAGQKPLLLVVDQFEEIFTLCEKESARQDFIDALELFIASPVGHVVILTMRSDFESFIARFPTFVEQYERGRVQVMPLSAHELREAIEQPAAAVGLKFEAGVVDALLHDLLGEPAGLPLLQFSLLTLWRRREHNRVTMATYRIIGGGREALARCADDEYGKLIPEEKATARRILLRLGRAFGGGVEVTRSRLSRSELYLGGEDPGRVDRVLERLVRARLLRRTAGATPAADQLEVAHEALVRNWPTLSLWLEQQKVDLTTRRRLEIRASEWLRLGSGPYGLLDAVELIEAERWVQSQAAQDLGFDRSLERLIAASKQQVERIEQEKEQRRQAELVVERRRSRQFALGVTALSVMLVTTLVMLAVALASLDNAKRQEQEAKRQKRHAIDLAMQAAASETRATEKAKLAEASAKDAEANAKAFLANNIQDRDPTMAISFALQAMRIKATLSTRSTLYGVLAKPQGEPVLTANDRVFDGGFSPDGNYVVTAAADRQTRIYDKNGRLLRAVSGQGTGRAVLFSPDSTTILTVDNSLRTWRLSDGKLSATLAAGRSAPSGASYSPDGTRIVAIFPSGQLAAFSNSGQRLWEARHAKAALLQIAFSPDGKELLTVAADRTVKLWDASGGLKATLADHTDSVNGASFSPSGRWVLTYSQDSSARLWDLAGKPLCQLVHESPVVGAAFSPDSSQVATAMQNGKIELWRTTDCQRLRPTAWQAHDQRVDGVAFSPDGSMLLSVSEDADNPAALWDTKLLAKGSERKKALRALLRGHHGPVRKGLFSADGSRILTLSVDKTARLWSTDGQPLTAEPALTTFRNPTADLRAARWSPDGQSILCGTADGNLIRFSLADRQRTLEVKAHSGAVRKLSYSRDGSRILTLAEDGTARVFSPTGQLLCQLSGSGETTASLAARGLIESGVLDATLSQDGQQVLTFAQFGSGKLWSVADCKVLVSLDGQQRLAPGTLESGISPDGQLLLTLPSDRTAQLWDQGGRPTQALAGHDGIISGALFSPDGQHVLTLSYDKTAILWTRDGVQLFALMGHEGTLQSGAFSPDGSRILTTSWDGSARLWTGDKGLRIATLRAEQGRIHGASFSPDSDGSRILTISTDRAARLWDGRSGEPLAVLPEHRGRVTAGSFSPDGKWLLTASADKTLRILPATDSGLLDLAAHVLGRQSSASP